MTNSNDKNSLDHKQSQLIEDEKKRQKQALEAAKANDVEAKKLKAKELRDSEQSTATHKDLVADKPWQLGKLADSQASSEAGIQDAIVGSEPKIAPKTDTVTDVIAQQESDVSSDPLQSDKESSLNLASNSLSKSATYRPTPHIQASTSDKTTPATGPITSSTTPISTTEPVTTLITPSTSSMTPTMTPPGQTTGVPVTVPIVTAGQVPTPIVTVIPVAIPNQVPTPTPNLTPNLTPDQVPVATPGQVPTPINIPDQVPNLTPDQIPVATPGQVPTPMNIPDQVPNLTPNLTPDQVPVATPGQVPTPMNIPNQVPTPTPNLTPNPTPDQVPVATPGQVPTPMNIPDQVPTPTPNLTPEQIPVATPGQVPTPMNIPDQVPTPTPNQIPVATPGQVPTPMNIPDQVPTPTPNQNPMAIPGQVPTPMNTPDQVPTPTPNQIPVAIPGQVPTPMNIPDPVPNLTPDQHPIAVPKLALTASITINPVTADNLVNATESKGTVEVSGRVTGDVKDGDTVSLLINGHGYLANVSAGMFKVDVSGADLAADNSVQAQVTASNPDGRSTTATDAHSYSVDTDIFAKDDHSTAIEDQGPLSTTGNVLDNDDKDNTQVTTTEVVGKYGTFHFKADGSYTYELDNTNVQHLNANDHVTDTVTYSITDGAGNHTTANLAVNIVGTNDDAVITGSSTADLTEDQLISGAGHYLYTTGILSSADVDNPDDRFQQASLSIDSNGQPTIGNLFINEHGHWTYNIDNDKIQNLGDGESLIERFVVQSVDGTAHEVIATVHGQTDVPAAIVVNVPNLAPVLSPNLNPVAVPHQVPTALPQHVPASATIAINDLTADNIINALESGKQVHVTGSVAGDVHDGDAISLTVNGQSYSAKASGGVFDVLVAGSDLAADNIVHAEVTGTSTTGDTALATDKHQYQTDLSTDLAFNTVFWDHKGSGILSVQLFAPKDADLTQLVIESSGGGTPIKVDLTTQYSVSDSIRQPDHQYIKYKVDVSSLPDGELHLSAQSIDAAGNTASANNSTQYTLVHLDTQVSATDDIATAIEDQGATATAGNVLTNDDHDGTSIIAGDIKGTYGTFHFNADGSYIYTLDNSKVQHFSLGEKHEDHTSYIVTDAAGNSAMAHLTVSIEGTNDAAIITGQKAADLTEDLNVDTLFKHAIAAKGELFSQDVDNPDNAFRESVTTDTDGGMFAILKTGDWFYQIANDKVQHLGAKETITHTFTVESVDGTNEQITVTVTGTNDNPVLSVNQSSNTSGVLTEQDVDTTDSHTFTTSNGLGHYGTLSVDAMTGAYSYSQTPSVAGMNYNPATETYSGKEVFAVEVKDNHSGVDVKYIVLDVTAKISAGNPPVITTQVTSPAVVTDIQPASTATQTTPPTNTVSIDLATLSDSGIDHSDNITNDNTPGITGHVDIPFSKVDIVELGQVIATTFADAHGHYQVDTPSLTDATHTLTAQATAPSATAAVSSLPLDVQVDTTSPTLVFRASSITYDNIINAQEAGTSIDVDGNIAGEYHAGDTVILTVNGKDFPTTVPDNGHFTISIPGSDLAADVNHQISGRVTSTDNAGNVGSATATYHYGVDTTSPTLVFRASSITRDNIINAQEAGTSIDVDGNIAGEYHAGDTVILTVNGKDFPTTLPDNGHFTISIPGSDLAADVNHQISGRVTSTDNAGNVGSATATYHYGVDTSTDTPTTDLDAATDTGISDHDNLTNLASPMITGTAEPDAAIKITDELGVIVATGSTNSRGVYHLTTTQLSEGSHTLTVEATDLAGNQASAAQVVEIDLTAPVIVKVGLGTEVTHQPTFKGTVSIDTASVDILIKQGGQVIETLHATLDGSGGYSVNSTSLPDGSYSAFIQATDRAGNVTMIGEKGSFDYFEIDTQAPIVTVDNIALTKDNTPDITGTVDDPAAIVRLFVAGVEYTAVNHGDGTWSLAGNSLTLPLPDGMANVIDVRATDVVGNSGYAKGTAGVDTQASITMNPISRENIVDIAEQQHSLTISGHVTGVEDGQGVVVSIGGQSYDAKVLHGEWTTSLTPAQVQALNGGINDVSASVSDLAGNTADMRSPLFVVDGSNQPPSMSFKTPPTPTGGGHLGAHISGVLVAPPLLQQLNPQQGTGGWAISDGHGHAVTSLRGHYGTLTIDPTSGHVEYIYNQQPTLGAKAAGGTHWAGQSIKEEHHDLFQVLYHDSHASNVDVTVNLDVTYTQGRSGHNHMTTQLVDMRVSPADTHLPPPPPSEDSVAGAVEQADEIEQIDPSDASLNIGSEPPITSHSDHANESENSSSEGDPVDHYFQMLGIVQTQALTEQPLEQGAGSLNQVDILSDVNGEADMLGGTVDDPFANPLDDEKHQDAVTLVGDSNIIEHDVSSTIDDDASLHQALNDMHSQI